MTKTTRVAENISWKLNGFSPHRVTNLPSSLGVSGGGNRLEFLLQQNGQNGGAKGDLLRLIESGRFVYNSGRFLVADGHHIPFETSHYDAIKFFQNAGLEVCQ